MLFNKPIRPLSSTASLRFSGRHNMEDKMKTILGAIIKQLKLHRAIHLIGMQLLYL